MTYKPHLLLQFGGRLFSTESWTCGLRMILGEPQTTLVSPEALRNWAIDNIEDVAADVSAWFTRSTSYNSSAARLDFVKLNAIREDGRYWDETTTQLVEFPLQTAPVGTLTPGEPQNSIVVSLLTAAQRGRASRGRFYPPTGNLAITPATGKVSASVTTDIAASAVTLMNDLANQPGLDLQSPRVVVASDLGAPGPMRNVTRLAVGDVVDTQRRRRRNLVETYTISADVNIVG